MLIFILTFLHVLVGLALIMIVLLQTGKGATLGAAFGGSSQTVFGSRGPASFLGKITTIAAVIFMLTSLTLAIYSKRPGTSAIEREVPAESRPSPSPLPTQPTESEEKSPGSQVGQPGTEQK